MPLVQTRGAASAQGFGEFAQAASVPNYIEEVFSTWLYTGNGANRTITNGIDLSTKGGLVWTKNRNSTLDHELMDTQRGAGYGLRSNGSEGQVTGYSDGSILSFNTDGYSLGFNADWNFSTDYTYASWTFRKQPKFFDIQTWTGTGANRTISHSLNSVPACILVKRTDTSGAWQVYHRSLANTEYLVLNSTAAAATGATRWNSTTPTSTVFSIGTDATVNDSGGTYVAYLFAHDAGGFGLAGTDNVISCGSFVSDGSGNATVSLGYEPQWLLTKQSSGAGGQQWYVVDTMRGWSLDTGTDVALKPNTSQAESAGDYGFPTATGFYQTGLNASATHIYIAIRRGPMRVPTVGTSVYTMALINPSSANNTNFVTSGFPIDLWMTITATDPFADPFLWMPRLTTLSLSSASTNAESGNPYTNVKFDGNTGMVNRTGTTGSSSLTPNWMLQRAPSFFDVVCYTGTGSNTNITHNLGVVPEMIICKQRSAVRAWAVYHVAGGNGRGYYLNDTSTGDASSFFWNSTTPNATTFRVGIASATNESAQTFVSYLFATCAGVSKVGSYTGTGATQTINCGFTGGARFVMVKRTDDVGAWYVWDTTRGMVSGTDPSLRFNTSASQVNANSVFTIATGFQIVSTAADINANGGTFIFLAIA